MFNPPMLAETAEAPFSHPDFIFEPKIDGHRAILVRRNGTTHIFTRHKTDCTRQYPELHDIALDDVVLDGEIACTDPETGMIDFESVMERFSARRADRIQAFSIRKPVNFVVFDVLQLNGIDIRGLPLMRRKEILSQLDFGNPHITLTPYIDTEGERLFDEVRARKLEGMVAKRKESTYVSRRSPAWQKVINWKYAEVVITGYRKDEFGWLTAIPDENGNLRPAGFIELGVTPFQKKAFYGVAKLIVVGENRDFVFLEPRIRARVKMRNWTKSGLLRSPVFVDFVI